MKINTNPIVFLFAIILVVCFISLFMNHKSGFEESFQEGLMYETTKIDTKTYFDTIFQDMSKLKSSSDSKSFELIDNINNNLLLLENKLNVVGNVTTTPTTIPANVTTRPTMMTKPTTTPKKTMTNPTTTPKKTMPTPTTTPKKTMTKPTTPPKNKMQMPSKKIMQMPTLE